MLAQLNEQQKISSAQDFFEAKFLHSPKTESHKSVNHVDCYKIKNIILNYLNIFIKTKIFGLIRSAPCH